MQPKQQSSRVQDSVQLANYNFSTEQHSIWYSKTMQYMIWTEKMAIIYSKLMNKKLNIHKTHAF